MRRRAPLAGWNPLNRASERGKVGPSGWGAWRMDNDRILIVVLGIMAVLLIGACAFIQGADGNPPRVLANALATVIGALLALARFPSKGQS